MHNLDLFLTSAINNFAGTNAAIDVIMISATYFGVPSMVLWTVLQWWTQDNRPYRRHVAVSTGLSFILGLLLNQIILLFVHRIRPYDAGITSLLISSTTDPSFPSDHATASFAICFGFLLNRLKREGLVLAIAASLIGFSRVYVGAHYLTDVIGGMLTALISSLLVIRFYNFGSRIDLLLTRLF